MLEAAIEDTVVSLAEKEGWLVRKVKWINRRNAADRFFAKDGRVVFIEFKAPGEKPRDGQSREIARMQAAGVEIHACDNPLRALRILGIAFNGR